MVRRGLVIVGLLLVGGLEAGAQYRTLVSEAPPPVCTVACPPGPQGPPGVPGPPGPRGPQGPPAVPLVCPPLPAYDLPLSAVTFIEPAGCDVYVLGYIGTHAFLVDLRGLRYQAVPPPLSGHAMLTTASSRTDPWLILAADASGSWLVRVTPSASWVTP